MKLICAIAGAFAQTFGVTVGPDAKISDLKREVWDRMPQEPEDTNPDSLMLFAARKPNGGYLHGRLEAVKELRQGKSRGVHDLHLLERDLELKDNDSVDTVFKNSPRYDHIHVLVVRAVVRILCLMPGVDQSFEVVVDIRKPVKALQQDIASLIGASGDDIMLFLAEHDDSGWIPYFGLRTEESFALTRREFPESTKALMTSELEMKDAYDLAGIEHTGNLHVLVGGPATDAFRGRTEQWGDIFRAPEFPRHFNIVYLNAVEWSHLQKFCQKSSYTQQQQVFRITEVDSLMRALRAVSTVLAQPMSDEHYHQFSLFAFLKDVVNTMGLSMKIHPEFRLENPPCRSDHSLGSWEFRGAADYVLSNGSRFVCIFQPRVAEGDEIGDYYDDEDEDETPGELAKRKMETAIAQAVVAMEIFNTHISKSAVGIVTNFWEWTFIKVVYDNVPEP